MRNFFSKTLTQNLNFELDTKYETNIISSSGIQLKPNIIYEFRVNMPDQQTYMRN